MEWRALNIEHVYLDVPALGGLHAAVADFVRRTSP
jgi:hypothetical protein